MLGVIFFMWHVGVSAVLSENLRALNSSQNKVQGYNLCTFQVCNSQTRRLREPLWYLWFPPFRPVPKIGINEIWMRRGQYHLLFIQRVSKKRSFVITALLEALGCSQGLHISQKLFRSFFLVDYTTFNPIAYLLCSTYYAKWSKN